MNRIQAGYCLKNHYLKIIFRFSSMMVLNVIILLILGGCQDEFEKTTPPDPNLVITSNSPVLKLIENASMRDGSHDNILDHSSCIALKLPVTVLANEQEVIISTEDDLKTVEQIFDASETDGDTLAIVFPITIIRSDHTELTVDNYDHLKDLISACTEGGEDEDIECIDFKYPLSLTIYNSENQVSDVIIINNDEDLNAFFEDLEDHDLAGFQFPVTLITSDGTEIVVTDNSQLEEAIQNHKDDCDEDDDNDYNDNDVDDTDFINVLKEGSWKVTYFFEESDQTHAFEGISFTFSADGTAQALSGSDVVNGTWDSDGDNGHLEVEFDFEQHLPYDKISEDWEIIEFTETKIQMEHKSDDGTHVRLLTFERI